MNGTSCPSEHCQIVFYFKMTLTAGDINNNVPIDNPAEIKDINKNTRRLNTFFLLLFLKSILVSREIIKINRVVNAKKASKITQFVKYLITKNSKNNSDKDIPLTNISYFHDSSLDSIANKRSSSKIKAKC